MSEDYNYDDEKKNLEPMSDNSVKTDGNNVKPGFGANSFNKDKKKGTGALGKIMFAIALGLVFGASASLVFVVSNKLINKTATVVEEKEEPKKDSEKKKDDDIKEEKNKEKREAPDNTESKEDRFDKEKTHEEAPVGGAVENNRENGSYVYSSVAEVAQAAMPSIVSITTKSVQEVMSIYGFGTRQYEAEGAGSGIIIGENDTELLIVTNNHVVEGATTLSVCFIDDEVCPAVIKGTSSNSDLAIVAVNLSDIKSETREKIKIAEMGNSDNLVIGEQVVAIGNALGYGQSVTTGIVSALNRTIKDGSGDSEYIQTDAAINPGNSGGALLDMNGKLIGINSAKLASTQIEGMGYAIPISLASPILEGLMNLTTRQKLNEDEAGYIGISGMSVNADVSRQYGMPEGVYVSEAISGYAADKAGIQMGDIIIEFDGINVGSISELRERLDYYKAGETVTMKISRLENGEYKERIIDVTLDSRKGTALDSSSEKNDEINNDQENERGYEDDNQRGGRHIEIPGFEEYGDIFDFFFN